MKRLIVLAACLAILMVGGVLVAHTASAATPELEGKIVETMDSGGYTYMNLDKDGRQVWVATPHAEVKVGQYVKASPGMLMVDFKSKSLGRTFDAIFFSDGLIESSK